jgi:type II secretory pathway component PulJ
MRLAELMVTLAILGLVMTALLTFLRQGQQAYATGAARVEAQQSARLALDRLARDLRLAGAGGSEFTAVSVAEPERVVLHGDVDGDGAIAGPGETITWRLAGTVLRRDAGGGGQPVMHGVRALRLAYLDGAGHATTIPAAVRTVRVALTAAADRATGPSAGAPVVIVATAVRLRNR